MRETPQVPVRGWGLPGALVLPIAGWLGMTGLRESQRFWRDAGGYPVWLREFVLETYYPITGLILLGAGCGIVRVLACGSTLRRTTVAGWLLVAATLGFGLAYAGANNLANLLDGRPLHAHPARE